MTEYFSSVLTCNIEEDGCDICEFLNGGHSVAALMEIIKMLDAQLATTEELNRTMTRLQTTLLNELNERDEVIA